MVKYFEGLKNLCMARKCKKAIIKGDIYIISSSKTEKRHDVALQATTRD